MIEIDWEDLGKTHLEKRIYHVIKSHAIAESGTEQRTMGSFSWGGHSCSKMQPPKCDLKTPAKHLQNTTKTMATSCFTGHTKLWRTVSYLDAASVRVFGCAPHFCRSMIHRMKGLTMSFQCQVSFPDQIPKGSWVFCWFPEVSRFQLGPSRTMVSPASNLPRSSTSRSSLPLGGKLLLSPMLQVPSYHPWTVLAAIVPTATADIQVWWREPDHRMNHPMVFDFNKHGKPENLGLS